MQEKTLTPSQINRLVKGELEMSFPRVLIEGEISNLAKPASGHLYFSLKDDRAQLNCALFRGSRRHLPFQPEDGQHVVARGKLSLYEASGRYQLIADRLELAGAGELQRRYEELKRRLRAEGLFADEHKQPLPASFARLAIITSASGAAVRDIVTVCGRRWPLTELRIYPVPVQGEAAPAAITHALEAANRQQWADVVVLARGGGSIEDLWAFNDEGVARAIFASRLPVVSAIGHEVDTVISDLVADLRAATPSAAAELLTPDHRQVEASLRQILTRLRAAITDGLQTRYQQLDGLSQRLRSRHPERQLALQSGRVSELRQRLSAAMQRRLADLEKGTRQWRQRFFLQYPGRQLEQSEQRLADCRRRLLAAVGQQIEAASGRLRTQVSTLNALNPLNTLQRGYSITEHNGTVITHGEQVKPGDTIHSRLACGCLRSEVTGILPDDD